MSKKNTAKSDLIPDDIVIGVYYQQDDKKIVFDIESMEQEFNNKISELRLRYEK